MTYDFNAGTWTSAEVLSDVRRKASLPASSTDFTDAVLLREASDVLWSFAGWALAQAGEGRTLAFLDRPVASSVLTSAYRAGEYPLPALAIADTIQNVTWLDSTGTKQVRLAQVDPAAESDFDGPTSTGDPQSYALLAGRIRIYPGPTTGGTLRISFQRRHGALVPTSSTDLITGASAASSTTTLLSIAGGTSANFFVVVGAEVDAISGQAPHRHLATSVTITAVGGGGVTVAAPIAQFSNMPISGARLCTPGETPFVSMPLELRPAVTEKITANVLRIIGDLQGSQAAEQAATLELSRVMQLLSPRAKRDKPKAVNPFSLLRRRIRGVW